MISFTVWMEYRDKDFSFFRNLVLGKLNLDRDEGLSAPLDTFQRGNLESILNSLGEFKELPSAVQDMALGKVRSGEGTVGDLVRIMASKTGDIRSQGDE